MSKFILFILSFSTSMLAIGQQDIFQHHFSRGLGSSFADGGEHIVYDHEGNMLVYGYFGGDINFGSSTNPAIVSPLGKPDLFLAKYSASGELNWIMKLGRISLSNGMNTGGLQVTSENEIVIAGSYTNNVNFNPLGATVAKTSAGGKDAFLAKYTSNGELIWINTYGSNLFDFGEQVAIGHDDNIYFGIRFNGDINVGSEDNPVPLAAQTGGSNAAIVKLTSDGEYTWNYHFYSSGNSNITAIGIAQNGNIALGTTVNGDNAGIEKREMELMLLNPEGNLLWNHNFDNLNYSNKISSCLFSENGQEIYIAGRIQGVTEFDSSSGSTQISPLFADPFFAKYEVETGNLIYAKSIQSAGIEDYTAGIATSGAAFLIVGSFDNTATFEPGNFNTQFTSQGEMDVFMAAYDKITGDFITAQTFGGSGNEHVRSATFDPQGNMLLTGNFSGSLKLDESGSTTSMGLTDIFVAEFSYQTNVGISKHKNEKQELTLYPVPADTELNIKINGISGGAVNIKIINILGAVVAEYHFANPGMLQKIDVSSFNSGVYILEAAMDSHTISKRFIKK